MKIQLEMIKLPQCLNDDAPVTDKPTDNICQCIPRAQAFEEL
jgi:hypothetical protein